MCMYMYQRVTRSEVAVSVKRRYNVILADTAYSRDREKSKTLEHRKILRFFDLNLNPWRIDRNLEMNRWKKNFSFPFRNSLFSRSKVLETTRNVGYLIVSPSNRY